MSRLYFVQKTNSKNDNLCVYESYIFILLAVYWKLATRRLWNITRDLKHRCSALHIKCNDVWVAPRGFNQNQVSRFCRDRRPVVDVNRKRTKKQQKNTVSREKWNDTLVSNKDIMLNRIQAEWSHHCWFFNLSENMLNDGRKRRSRD